MKNLKPTPTPPLQKEGTRACHAELISASHSVILSGAKNFKSTPLPNPLPWRGNRTNLPGGSKKAAFTLAEVLITLGIIGIVAALVIPSIMDSYYKSIVETRLKKFYSVFNQAIVLSETKNGPKETWFQDVGGIQLDKNGNPIPETSKMDKWFSTYLTDFITVKKQFDKKGQVYYYLPDGSAFKFGSGVNTIRDIKFFPFGNVKQCESYGGKISYGKCVFLFNFIPNDTSPQWKYLYGKGLEPFLHNWNGNKNALWTHYLYGCKDGQNHAYCTAIIKQNGWKIPENYPHKVRP